MDFEWDLKKDAASLAKHGIAFSGAARAFSGPMVLRRSDRGQEVRWVGVGRVGRHVVAIVFTRRGSVIRLISARKARKNEKATYLALHPV